MRAVDKSIRHQEFSEREIISEKILGTPRIKPGAAGREASMLSSVLCGPPKSQKFDQKNLEELFLARKTRSAKNKSAVDSFRDSFSVACFFGTCFMAAEEKNRTETT